MKTILSILMTAAIFSPAFSICFEHGQNVRIGSPVMEDTYIAAGNISIDAKIGGDLIAAGGTIAMNDTVTGDLAVAGGTITLRGAVLDDVRSMGGNLTISGFVGGDLIVMGGTVTIERGAVIAGDLITAGGTVRLDGTVNGSVKTGTGEFLFNGKIAKNATLKGGKVTLNGIIGGETVLAVEKLFIEPGASLAGDVRYWTSEGEASFGAALKNGKAVFDPSLKVDMQQPRPKYLGFAGFMGVLWYLLAMFVLLAVGNRLFGRFFDKTIDAVQAEPMRALGYGFMYFVAVPVAIILVFITVIGIPVAMVGLVLYVLLLALASATTALAAAHWMSNWKGFNLGFWKTTLLALGILVILNLIGMIPFLGWFVKFVAVCIAFGAILLNLDLFKRRGSTIKVQ